MANKLKYRPRNDYVVVRLVNSGMVGKLAMPDVAAQGKDYFVAAKGPNVEDLEVGDQVMMVGKVGEDIAVIPNERDLFIIKQANIVFVIDGDGE